MRHRWSNILSKYETSIGGGLGNSSNQKGGWVKETLLRRRACGSLTHAYFLYFHSLLVLTLPHQSLLVSRAFHTATSRLTPPSARFSLSLSCRVDFVLNKKRSYIAPAHKYSTTDFARKSGGRMYAQGKK